MSALPPLDLDCPDPPGCTVLDAPAGFGTVVLAAGTPLFRVYSSAWGYDEPNPGHGDARFSPIDDPVDHRRLSSLYAAETEPAALLETVFHEVHHDSSRTVYEAELRGQLLAHVSTPRDLRLVDLRNAELARLGYERNQVASSSAEHYPCTRRLAIRLLADFPEVAGFLWHSRQAELHHDVEVEVVVVFGRVQSDRGSWPLRGPGNRNLYEGPGRLLVDQVAEDLDAVVVAEDPTT